MKQTLYMLRVDLEDMIVAESEEQAREQFLNNQVKKIELKHIKCEEFNKVMTEIKTHVSNRVK